MSLKDFTKMQSLSALIRVYRSCGCRATKPQQMFCRFKSTEGAAPKTKGEEPVMFRPPTRARPMQMPRKTSRKRFRFVDEGGYILLVFPLTSFALGFWQLQRREWKLALIEKLAKRTAFPPVQLPEDLRDLEGMEFRPVKVRGTYDYTKEVFIGPRSVFFKNPTEYTQATGKVASSVGKLSGAYVVTPLKLADRRETILVNRGWLSTKQVDTLEYRQAGQQDGEVELVGLVRLNEKEVSMVPSKRSHDLSNGSKCYLYRNLDLIGSDLGTAPVYLDSTEWQPWKNAPIGGQTKVNLRNEHMSYALTWFCLGALTLIIWRNKFNLHNTMKSKPQQLAETYRKRR